MISYSQLLCRMMLARVYKSNISCGKYIIIGDGVNGKFVVGSGRTGGILTEMFLVVKENN